LSEVREARCQLRHAQLQPLVLDGVQALFERSAHALEHRPPAATTSVEDSLAWLETVAALPPLANTVFTLTPGDKP